MSIQKASQVLNTLGQQLPAIAQAQESGADPEPFTRGLLNRFPMPTDSKAMVEAFIELLLSAD